MPAFESCITSNFFANIIYPIEPTFNKSFLFRIFVNNSIIMLSTGFKQFFLQPFIITAFTALLVLSPI